MKCIKSNPTIKMVKRGTFGRLLLLTKPYHHYVIWAVVCVLLVNGAQLLKPYILKFVIDDFLVGRKNQTIGYSILSMGILYFMIVLAGGIFSIIQSYLMNKLSQSIMKEVRGQVFKIIQYLPLSQIDQLSSGRLITRATNDVEALSDLYTNVLINLFKDCFLLIGIIAAMLLMNVELALISFSVVPIMFILVFMLKKKIKENFTRMKHYIGQINGFMAENISGMALIQLYQAEKEKLKEFLALNEQYFKTTVYQVQLNSLLRPASDVFQTLAVAFLLTFALGKIENLTLEVGVLYAFTTYIKQFFAPISDLAENYTTIQSALVSADRIFELVDQKDQMEELEEGLSIPILKGEVEFKHVWFAYTGEEWILKDVSFKINAGEIGAFVGETGAGKTTIISLISGFYPVTRGEILVDGVNINEYKLSELRRKVVVVLQDVFLFAGSLRDNITLNDEIEDSIIHEALKASCAQTFINALPNQLEERVREHGSAFSAGQKQLLSFARALAHQPTILVLDEATANIDTQTEQVIQEAILNVTKDRTTLIIAHRLSTIRQANQIIVLKEGRVVETGNHEQLIKQSGYYARLIQSSKENIKESV